MYFMVGDIVSMMRLLLKINIKMIIVHTYYIHIWIIKSPQSGVTFYIHCSAVDYSTMPCNVVPYPTMQCSAVQCHAMQCNATQHNTKQHNLLEKVISLYDKLYNIIDIYCVMNATLHISQWRYTNVVVVCWTTINHIKLKSHCFLPHVASYRWLRARLQ